MSEKTNPKGAGRKKLHRDNRIHVTNEELDVIKDMRRFEETAKEQGLDPTTVKHAWFKSKEASLFAKNPLFDDGGELSRKKIEESIERIVDKHKRSIVRKKLYKTNNTKQLLLNVFLSDAHVGMNPNPNGEALFQYEYNREIFEENMKKVLISIEKEHTVHGVFEELHINDLGDAADGWNGYTTRGGHQLPQNLTNAEVFETCVDTKVEMVKHLVEAKIANKIVLRSVSNDNHAGDFGLIINMAIKKIINLMYDHEMVEVDILTKFIEHRYYGDHCFLLTHGKDKANMSRGLPLNLTDKVVRFVNDIIYHFEIDKKYIHLYKGDLHQVGYEKTKRFDYRNFMSFAPPSNWVQHNFGDSYSGYSIQVIPKYNNEISHTDYSLDYRKLDVDV